MCIYFDSLSSFGSDVIRFLLKNRNTFSCFTILSPSPKLCAQMSTLPEECLLLIFDRIPLAQLLQFDQVCHRWAKLLPSATVRRHTLALIVSVPLSEMRYPIPYNDNFEMSIDGGRAHHTLSLPEREASLMLPFLTPKSFDEFLLDGDELEGFFDILYYTSLGDRSEEHFTEMARFRNARLSGDLVSYFTGLFPKMKNLVVMHPLCYEGELHSIIGLLSSWSLVKLKLYIRTFTIDARYVDRPDKHPVDTLLLSIKNQQPSLQQLTLDISGHDQANEFTFPVESYSFIAQLKVVKLYFGKFDLSNSIWDIVHRFGSNNLREINLGTFNSLQPALNRNFKFASKVRQLYLLRWFQTVEQLSQICSRFTSLTMLQLYWTPNIPFAQLVVNLASLTQLTYLKFFIYFEDHPMNAFTLINDGAVRGDEEEPRRISLPQVKILELHINMRTHRDFESFSSLVFPSVETIILEYLLLEVPIPERACFFCRHRNIGPHTREMANRCKQLLISSLRDKFANPLVQMFAEGAIVNIEHLPDSRLDSFKTVATLMAVFVGLPLLFENIQTN